MTKPRRSGTSKGFILDLQQSDTYGVSIELPMDLFQARRVLEIDKQQTMPLMF